MTTFTMQDLTPTQQEQLKKHEELHATYQHLITDTPTREEEEAMDTLAKQQESNAQAVATAMDGYIGIGKTAVLETIQGATGAQYTPIDMTQFHKPLEEIQGNSLEMQNLFITLTSTIQAIVKLSVEQYKPQSQPVSEGLAEAVETVLEQADWFANKVDEKLDELVDDHDFSYEVEQAVENHFGDFCLEDHVDVSSEIESVIDDRLDDMVQEKVEEILREKLSTATITFN